MAASKVFVVTGASKGIGAAIVKQLLDQSHKVVIAARSEEPLKAIKDAYPDHVEYVSGDLTDQTIGAKIIDTCIKAFGRLDGVVLNHALIKTKKLADIPMDEFRQLYDVNVFSFLPIVQAALPHLRKSKGSIVWISSGTVSLTFAAWGAYSSSKCALNSLSAHVSLEEPDVTSVTIEPGRVDTDLQADIRAAGKDVMDQAVYENFIDVHKTGELLKPEQPAKVIANFVSNPAKELSGKDFSWNSSELAAYQ